MDEAEGPGIAFRRLAAILTCSQWPFTNSPTKVSLVISIEPIRKRPGFISKTFARWTIRGQADEITVMPIENWLISACYSFSGTYGPPGTPQPHLGMGVAESATVPGGSLEFITASRDPHSRYATSADRNSGSPGSPISSALSSSRLTHRRRCASEIFRPK